eukprot:scaffold9176_cov104-Isochrysis_galbana.AAC.2
MTNEEEAIDLRIDRDSNKSEIDTNANRESALELPGTTGLPPSPLPPLVLDFGHRHRLCVSVIELRLFRYSAADQDARRKRKSARLCTACACAVSACHSPPRRGAKSVKRVGSSERACSLLAAALIAQAAVLGSAPVERRQASAVGRERVRVLVGEERLAVRIEYRLTELRADVVRDCPVEAVDGHAARRRCVEAVPLEEAGGRVVGVGEQVEHACGAAGGGSGAGGGGGRGGLGCALTEREGVLFEPCQQARPESASLLLLAHDAEGDLEESPAAVRLEHDAPQHAARLLALAHQDQRMVVGCEEHLCGVRAPDERQRRVDHLWGAREAGLGGKRGWRGRPAGCAAGLAWCGRGAKRSHIEHVNEQLDVLLAAAVVAHNADALLPAHGLLGIARVLQHLRTQRSKLRGGEARASKLRGGTSEARVAVDCTVARWLVRRPRVGSRLRVDLVALGLTRLTEPRTLGHGRHVRLAAPLVEAVIAVQSVAQQDLVAGERVSATTLRAVRVVLWVVRDCDCAVLVDEVLQRDVLVLLEHDAQ